MHLKGKDGYKRKERPRGVPVGFSVKWYKQDKCSMAAFSRTLYICFIKTSKRRILMELRICRKNIACALLLMLCMGTAVIAAQES